MKNFSNPEESVRYSGWKIWLLGIYIFLLLIAAGYFLIGLILADTTQTIDSLAACRDEKANVVPNDNGAADSANTNANTAANANSNAAVNANTPNTNTANTNVNAATANKNTSAAANTGTNQANTSPANTQKPPSATPTPTPQTYTIPKIVKVDFFAGLFGYFKIGGCMTGDGYLFLLVLFAGMVGAGVRGISSFFVHVGRRDFGFNWLWFYLFLPFFGSSLSLVLYLVIRGGFYGGAVGQAVSLNAYSFAALGALTGLFSDQAMEKLKMVAESLLTKTPSKTIEITVDKIEILPDLSLTKTKTTERLTATAKDEFGNPILNLDNTNFNWVSDNPAIATVDSQGNVRFVSEGICNVKAISTKFSVVSNNCEVTCGFI